MLSASAAAAADAAAATAAASVDAAAVANAKAVADLAAAAAAAVDAPEAPTTPSSPSIEESPPPGWECLRGMRHDSEVRAHLASIGYGRLARSQARNRRLPVGGPGAKAKAKAKGVRGVAKAGNGKNKEDLPHSL